MVFKSVPDLPVLLIYNIDPAWSPAEREGAHRDSRRIGFAMRRQGHSVDFLPVCDPDFTGALSGYEPRDVLVFNWCEGVPGIERSEVMVAEMLEKLRFTYTGRASRRAGTELREGPRQASPPVAGVPTPRWKIVTSPRENGWEQFPAIVKPACEHCSHGIDPGAVVTAPRI